MARNRRRAKNGGYRQGDLVHTKDGRIGRIRGFSRVPNGRRVAFINPNPDPTATDGKQFTAPIDELRMANVLDRIAWDT